MIKFTKTITQEEVDRTYINLRDDYGKPYSGEFPESKTELCIVDDLGNEYLTKMLNNTQIWGSISQWFIKRRISRGTGVTITYDSLERRNGIRVVHIEIKH
ncbi:MAG TPA: hypothetical protein VK808_02615 [Bacteroidia bacterium]|jgi:hypothetical protein|nr:hypothetical protein [Bacteroidia bacterium]